MLKLIKYEFIKSRVILIGLFGVFVALQIFTMYSINVYDTTLMATALMLLMLVAFTSFVMIFILGIQSYSKELHSKSSYMIFMTPNSTYKIIFSKILYTLFIALLATLIGFIMFALDLQLMINAMGTDATIDQIIKIISVGAGRTIQYYIHTGIVLLISLWISLFSSLCIAYLSITLSATAFATSKFKGLFSVIFFIAITFAINYIAKYIPSLSTNSSYISLYTANIPIYLYEIVIIAAASISSAILLDKKVSL